MYVDTLYRGIKQQNYLEHEWVEGYLAKGIFGERTAERPDSHWCIIRKEETITDHGNEYCLRSYEICQYSICKFTGYIDNNKNKIWVDSIVKITCSDNEFALPCDYYLVTYDEEAGSYILQNLYDHDGPYNLLNILMFDNYTIEVVGDLCHDSDLIHGKERHNIHG